MALVPTSVMAQDEPPAEKAPPAEKPAAKPAKPSGEAEAEAPPPKPKKPPAFQPAPDVSDDLGSQPLREPTPAELGILPPKEARPQTPPAPTPGLISPPPTSISSGTPTAPAGPRQSATWTAPPELKGDAAEKAAALVAELTAALEAFPTPEGGTAKSEEPKEKAGDKAGEKAKGDLEGLDARALAGKLESLAGVWVNESMASSSPSIRPLQKLAKVRAAELLGRFDDADRALRDAITAVDGAGVEGPQARRLRGAQRFMSARLFMRRSRSELFGADCGRTLGLRRLAAEEAERRHGRLNEIALRFGVVARGPDRFWGRRAAYEVAALYEEVARQSLQMPLYRTVALPGPYAVDVVDTAQLVRPTLVAWVSEIRRAYGEILGAIDIRDPDPALAVEVKRKAADLGSLDLSVENERVESPWHKGLHPGLIRVAKRAERLDDEGRFVPIETRVAVDAMVAALAAPPRTSIDAAFALAGLASVAPEKLEVPVIVEALSSDDERMVVAGLIAAERVVRAKGGLEKASLLREPVTAAFAQTTDDAKAALFSTLAGSLYGRGERAVVALLAIGAVDRESADAILADDRLPIHERAWMAADIADPRFAQRFDSWGYDRDERVAALAVWGGLLARGRRHAGYLLRPQDNGLVGCVSRAVPE